jgi:hypothetical protein
MAKRKLFYDANGCWLSSYRSVNCFVLLVFRNMFKGVCLCSCEQSCDTQKVYCKAKGTAVYNVVALVRLSVYFYHRR